MQRQKTNVASILSLRTGLLGMVDFIKALCATQPTELVVTATATAAWPINRVSGRVIARARMVAPVRPRSTVGRSRPAGRAFAWGEDQGVGQPSSRTATARVSWPTKVPSWHIMLPRRYQAWWVHS